jgi:hypothetical protein
MIHPPVPSADQSVVVLLLEQSQKLVTQSDPSLSVILLTTMTNKHKRDLKNSLRRAKYKAAKDAKRKHEAATIEATTKKATFESEWARRQKQAKATRDSRATNAATKAKESYVYSHRFGV